MPINCWISSLKIKPIASKTKENAPESHRTAIINTQSRFLGQPLVHWTTYVAHLSTLGQQAHELREILMQMNSNITTETLVNSFLSLLNFQIDFTMAKLI